MITRGSLSSPVTRITRRPMRTTSLAPTRAPITANLPLTVTPPALIRSSIARREPTPACASILGSLCVGTASLDAIAGWGVFCGRLRRRVMRSTPSDGSNGAPFDDRLRQRAAIDVLELAADRQAARDARHLHAACGEQLADVVRRGLAFDREVGGKYGFLDRAVDRPADQAVKMDFLGADTVERR